jgi:hypothetical protein
MFEVKAEAVDNTLNPNAAPDANTANRLVTDRLNALGLSRDVKTVANFARHHRERICCAALPRGCGRGAASACARVPQGPHEDCEK